MTQLIPVLILTLVAWLWWGGTRARETAVAAARRACQQCGVQFLDDSVVMARIRLRRDSAGHMRVLRRYHFEFSTDGSQRSRGYAVMLGRQLLDLHLELLVEPPGGVGRVH